jgi:uncharacterized protein
MGYRAHRGRACSLALATLLLAAAAPVPAAQTPDEARAALARQKVPWGWDAFVDRAAQGDTAVVRLFLAAGMRPDAGAETGRRALAAAAEKGELETVRALLAAGATVDLADPDGRTPLKWAALSGRTDVVRALLAAGADPKVTDRWGSNALTGAVASGDVGAVEAMLAKGADPTVRDSEGGTPLADARDLGLTPILERFARAGFPAPPPAPGTRSTADRLEAAVLLDDLAEVKRILASGAAPDAPSARRSRPLQHAAGLGRMEITRALLAAGAKAEVPREFGRPPLNIAAVQGHADTVRLLLAHGADPNAAMPDGTTPLMFAAAGGRADVVRTLLEGGARVDATDRSGRSPLTMAAAVGHVAAVRLLLAHGADPGTADGKGWTALMMAAGKGAEATTATLLDAGAPVNARGPNRQTAMDLALVNQRVAAARRLEAAGGVPSVEGMLVPFDPAGWKVGFRQLRGRLLTEFVPVEETVEDWTRILTVETITDADGPLTIDKFLAAKRDHLDRICPGRYWHVIRATATATTYEWALRHCPAEPDQHAIGRMVQGHDHIHHAVYIRKVPDLPSDERTRWLDWFEAAHVLEASP